MIYIEQFMLDTIYSMVYTRQYYTVYTLVYTIQYIPCNIMTYTMLYTT
jgi:hypothetical protein